MNGKPHLFAILIGIDCYLPNLLPDGKTFRSLRGCVRDISRIEDFLTRRQALAPERTTRLLSTNGPGGQPAEPLPLLPSYENIVAAFKQVTATAVQGDQVYVHYSGHGGRATTARPDLKGAGGVDESLVPYDIGKTNGRYLRDFELAELLRAMVARGLIVAVVLDSCHSGGMVRGDADVDVRGLDTVDTTPRRIASAVASKKRLAATWRAATATGTRDLAIGSGWLPEPQGYTLLAACRPSESALEYAFDGVQREGVLTHWLLDSLQDIGPGLSYKVVHDRILARVHSQFEMQTPQLQGEGDRAVLGSDRISPVYAAPVMRFEPAKNRVLINAGQAHNVRKGAGFAIFSPGETNLADEAQRLALATVSEDPGATECWAAISKKLSDAPITPGAQAVLLSSVRLVRRASLVRRGLALGEGAALAAVQQALAGSGWIELAAAGQEVAYQVTVNAASEYELWDAQGAAIANLAPPLPIAQTGAPAAVAGRLVHMAKFHALMEFANHDQLSPLARKLGVELMGSREEYDPVEAFVAETAFAGGAPALKSGQWTALRVKNGSTRRMNVTVLNLRPSWEVSQVFPAGEGDDFVELEPGQEIVIPLRANLRPGVERARDTLKVFATVGTTSFRWLELPPLDGQMTRSESVRNRTPRDSLEELLSAFTDDRPRTRDLIPAAFASHQWTTEQVTIEIHT